MPKKACRERKKIIYLVFFAQIFLVVLTVLLISKIYFLVKRNGLAVDKAGALSLFQAPDSRLSDVTHSEYLSEQAKRPNARIDSLAKSQIFTSAQLLAMKQKGFYLKSNDPESWLTKAVACYLIGASTQISANYQCSAASVDDVIMFVLGRNLDLPYDVALSYLTPEFINSGEAYKKALFQSGKKAAAEWLIRVPPKNPQK